MSPRGLLPSPVHTGTCAHPCKRQTGGSDKGQNKGIRSASISTCSQGSQEKGLHPVYSKNTPGHRPGGKAPPSQQSLRSPLGVTLAPSTERLVPQCMEPTCPAASGEKDIRKEAGGKHLSSLFSPADQPLVLNTGR